ncbi:FG-GAP repeat domain-containing protein [Mucilaginibacter glaciei]|uniref:VCBS repeat-containing protein n=1 Tax=Mucilaginibacter glaciei TaxID=2772109 RepID=A0A926NTQ1_9SPHI|nr:VCBS repeat-containing protein [Mucilaginibacter glaciei]MBD1394417.1 VCBS repeat-containing protein [Mucilaginibacter glaciei]
MKLNRTFLFTSSLLSGIFLLAAGTLFNGCKSKPTQAYELTGDTIADGKALVQLHCTKCHSLVPVNALTKTVWTVHSLPAMSQFLGISTYGTDYYKADKDTAGLSLLEWQSIVTYYKKMAPDTLMPAKAPSPLLNDWAGFSIIKPAKVNDICFTTMVASSPNTGKLYTGDVVSGYMTGWTRDLKESGQTKLPSAAVNAEFVKDSTGAEQAIISCIGRLDPVDFPNGRIYNVALGSKNQQPTEVASDLPRPVQTLNADFDKDGSNEIIVLGQGHLRGGIFLLKPTTDHKSYKQFTISSRAGAVQAVTGDFNKDGWLDLMVLFGENNEGLALLLNDHKGGFTSKDLLNFPPTNGSTSFQLADMDHDGKLDLIYTCGYNFRDSRILKPYHGLYIFKNLGDFKFKQTLFYPINGCTKAIATDFDKDGDLDIATIAFFADMKSKPAEEFIYFEQDKPMNFKAHAVPVSQNGRWLSMEVTDHDGDGKPDIILGNYAAGFLFQPNFTPNWDEHTPFIILQNNTGNKHYR